MEVKEVKIQVPKGYEVDMENSTFECIRFKPKKLSYEDVAEKLFTTNKAYCIDSYGTIIEVFRKPVYPNNCTSEKQAKKLFAINKLMNVAKYLNENWKPDWNNAAEFKYFHYTSYTSNSVHISYTTSVRYGTVYFKTEELAQQATNILGEETIRLALSTDW